MKAKSSDNYYKDYNGLQYVKHQILSKYLDAWFQILPRKFNKVIYVDTHAGRGRHETGDIGSPLVATSRLLITPLPEDVAEGTKVNLYFYELKQEYCDILESELAQLHTPDYVQVNQPICGDYEFHLSELLSKIDNSVDRIPLFAFIDPFNCTLSMDLLRRIFNKPHRELMLNLMYLELRKEAVQPQMSTRLDRIYGSDVWRSCLEVENNMERARCFATVFAEQLGASYIQPPVEMWARGQIKYFLIHATNSPLGYDRMKNAIWSVIKDGSYHATEEDRPEQTKLKVSELNLRPLRSRIEKFSNPENLNPDKVYKMLIKEYSHFKLTHVRKVISLIFKDKQNEYGQQTLL